MSNSNSHNSNNSSLSNIPSSFNLRDSNSSSSNSLDSVDSIENNQILREFVITGDSQYPLTLSQYYSEEARSPRQWDSQARDRHELTELELRNIRELSNGENHFLGINLNHPVSDSDRFLAENNFPTNPSDYFRLHYPQEPIIRTTITLYPDSYPVFEFTNPTSGTRITSAYPSARDHRLDRNSRIILQALEVSLTDPHASYWEEFYQEQRDRNYNNRTN